MPRSSSRWKRLFVLAVLVMQINSASGAASLEARAIPGKSEEGSAAAADPALGTSHPYTLGCILPLSGKFAAYGNRALESLILAAGFFDPQRSSSVKLLIEDSQSRPEKARAAVARLVREGVVAIIGPLGSEEAQGVAEEAQRLKVPLLTLTQKEGITAIGEYIFRGFLAGSQQIEKLVKFAREDLQLQRFAVLYPEVAQAREMAGLFRQEVTRRGGTIVWTGAYKNDQTDFAEPVKKLTAATEVTRIENDQVEGSPSRSFNFEAVFIPDSYRAVKMIVPQLVNYDVRGVRLLGMSGWNSPELLYMEEPGNLEGAVFTDSFFTAGIYPPTLDFVDRFYAAYGREPDVMEAEVFDAAGMAVKILLEGKGGLTREKFRNSLLGISSYQGVTGRSSFSTKRFIAKEAFVLMVKDGKIVQVK